MTSPAQRGAPLKIMMNAHNYEWGAMCVWDSGTPEYEQVPVKVVGK